ncbi:hypothetical protein [Cupriavidus sp. UGS-1]|uniref:hypothetical protein n=1 Tax=Cupriavidus sp. UGS-1 TaxID=2899826 RepID=UPI001E521986|nr:hypothetical protein [Cupriavidus sp. UGS-1]MCD9120665.1 hypothetical protein [Cupriavidus sp. UGS-1]
MSLSFEIVALTSFVLGFIVNNYLPAYLKGKGANLATKEDIAQITKLQEEVKHSFNVLLEQSKQRNSLRVLVAEERMRAHQAAFLHVHRLLSARDNTSVIEECRTWANENCLYLAPDARQAFYGAIAAAENRAMFLTEARSEGTSASIRSQYHDKAVDLWSEIARAFPAIVKGAELPPFSAEEENTMLRSSPDANNEDGPS